MNESAGFSAATSGDSNCRALEAVIRAIVAFFAAILAVGIKSLIEPNEPLFKNFQLPFDLVPAVIEKHVAPLLVFVTAASLFARFIIGASAHLTFELVDSKHSTKRLPFDILFLSIYGVIGLSMCEVEQPRNFAIGGAVFCFAALVWYLLDLLLSVIPKLNWHRDHQRWKHFWVVNTLNIAAFALSACLFEQVPESPAWILLGMAAANITLLFSDVSAQLGSIGTKQPT